MSKPSIFLFFSRDVILRLRSPQLAKIRRLRKQNSVGSLWPCGKRRFPQGQSEPNEFCLRKRLIFASCGERNRKITSREKNRKMEGLDIYRRKSDIALSRTPARK